MKKVLGIALLMGILMVGSTSCFKTYVCECRSTAYPDRNYNYDVGPSNKKNAKADCENYEFDYSSDPTYNCELQ